MIFSVILRKKTRSVHSFSYFGKEAFPLSERPGEAGSPLFADLHLLDPEKKKAGHFNCSGRAKASSWREISNRDACRGADLLVHRGNGYVAGDIKSGAAMKGMDNETNGRLKALRGSTRIIYRHSPSTWVSVTRPSPFYNGIIHGRKRIMIWSCLSRNEIGEASGIIMRTV